MMNVDLGHIMMKEVLISLNSLPLVIFDLFVLSTWRIFADWGCFVAVLQVHSDGLFKTNSNGEMGKEKSWNDKERKGGKTKKMNK